MPAPSTDISSAPGSSEFADLILEVRDLRQRVLNLEKRLGTAAATPVVPAAASPLPPPEPDRRAPAVPSDVVPVLGRMLIAIAGAYILRALTELGVLPAAAGVAIGLVYALVWLWVAARSAEEAKFEVAVNCSTSVLIMVPLVWEAVGSLKVMSSAASAVVLAGFAVIGLVIGSRTRHRMIATITGVSSIVTAFTLLLARNDIVPFTAALLVIAAATELAAWGDLRPGARAFAALAADSSVLLFTFLVSRRQGMPETWVAAPLYAVLAAQLSLALTYIGTAVTQTMVRQRALAFPEIAQAATALLIGIGGAGWVFREDRAVALALGIAALTTGLACYAVSFLLFEREHKWNFRAWATFGLFLVLAGFFVPSSRFGFWALSVGFAVACCWTARAFRLPTLGLHGAAYLLAGAAVAGVLRQPLQILFGAEAVAPEWPASIAVLVAAVVSWIAIPGTSAGDAGRWRSQIASFAFASCATWIAAGLIAFAVIAGWRSFAGGTVPSDTLGTVVIAGMALTLAWTAAHGKRRELEWLLYALMVVGAYKLATRDFMNEHNLPLVVSLLSYGGTLILLPRMLRSPSKPGDSPL
jgi:hypothetical protein